MPVHRDHRLLILFPGALGDFLCALPSFLALQREHRDGVLLVANPAPLELVEHGPFRTASIQRREIADLFADGPPLETTRTLLDGVAVTHSWTGSEVPRLPERLRSITGGTVYMHRFRDMRPNEHAIDYYAGCVGLPPAEARVWTTAEDEAWADTRSRLDHGPLLVVHPGSGSLRKNWEGFPELVRRGRTHYGAVIVVLGPAEFERDGERWADIPAVRDAGLRQIAALLRRAALYVGNDSGISHLAALVGTPSLVLFGPSDPTTWAPRGPRVQILVAPALCPRCGPERFCTHRLPVERVLRAAQRQRSS